MDTVLPNDLIAKILLYLNMEQDQKAFSLVCKQWLSLERLNRQTILVRFTDATDALLKLLADRYTNVRNVSIDESPFTCINRRPIYAAIGLICRFPRIIEMDTSEEINKRRMYCLTDAGLAAVGEDFAKLESLRLISCSNITDVGLISIAEKCKLLKSLNLESCFVGDTSLAAIGKCCTRLEVLNLAYCDSLADAGLVQFARHRGRNLKSLGICKCKGLTDVSLQVVGSHATALDTLSIVSESINDKGLISIARGCSLLRSLKIECQNITDETLQAIGHFCLSLELLALCNCVKLTDKSLFSIGKGCKKLKSLSIKSCYSLSEMGLDDIAQGCAELIRLETNSCLGIGTAGVKSIGKLACTNLSELVLTDLEFQNVDNDALREIGTGYNNRLRSLHMISCYGIKEETLLGITRLCTNLKKLDISYSQEIGYKQIICIGENCKSLTRLYLRYCSRITNIEIQAIARAFPQLTCLDVSGLQKLMDTGMAAVTQVCPFLKDLKIDDCPDLTDSSLNYVAKNCTLLESCSLKSCPGITKFGVKDFVMRCRNLKEIGGEKWKLGYLDIESIGPTILR